MLPSPQKVSQVLGLLYDAAGDPSLWEPFIAQLLASISLYRGRSRSEFTQSDLHILEFLAPHLQRAFKLHFALSEARAHSAGAEAALEMLPTGIVMLGPRGEIIFMNQCAAGMIAENDGLLVIGNQLRAERSVESEHLTAMVESALSISTGRGISAGGGILISRRTRPPLQVVISPIRNTKVQSFQKTGAIAFINDPCGVIVPQKQYYARYTA